uniref:Prolyl endopeptidase n=1 Tax=Rhodosorus marinus TaxID=101924 RepID=A0A7S2ZBJ8_9RHOD|mmetsp:Transcript_11128/g.46467  ORF Transcript_11128/g.46467 Transcript_11128/m.46467 type:complete len:483 (+) Transcript_11128:1570-3018(+)
MIPELPSMSICRRPAGTSRSRTQFFFETDRVGFLNVHFLTNLFRNVYMYERKEEECFIWQIERSCTSPRLIYDERLGADSAVEDLNNQLILLRDPFRMYISDNDDTFKWDLLYELSPPRRIVRFDVFNKFVVLYVRDGVNAIVQVINEDGGRCEVAIPDDCYSIRVLPNPNVNCNTLKLKYSTFTTPTQIWEVNMKSMRTRVLAAERILFTDLKRFHTRRLTASSTDGLAISISLVEPKDRPYPRPCVIMAYGAYGVTCEPEFSVPILCLLEQGISFAIVHVRGGGEVFGRWSKNQAVEDLVRGIQELVSLGIVDSTMIFGWGSSAGGSLFAATAKRQPGLFTAIALVAPFSDVAGELMKPGTPSSEIQEWFDLETDSGRQQFTLYNPMDLASVGDTFPDLLLIGYELDDRAPVEQIVGYYDRVRNAVPAARIDLRIVPEAGHSGPSDPFEKTRVSAAILSFFICNLESRLSLAQKNLGLSS